MNDTDQLEAALSRHATELSLRDQALAATRLAAYTELLRRWAPKVNLVSLADLPGFVEHHIVPSLSLRAALLTIPHTKVIDVGSGAGLPGIPLATSMPETRFTLVESRRKRANFLRQAVRTLDLHWVDVACCRVEDWTPPQPADLAISRAVTNPQSLRRLARHTIHSGGCFLTTRGPASLETDPPPGVGLTVQGSATNSTHFTLYA